MSDGNGKPASAVEAFSRLEVRLAAIEKPQADIGAKLDRLLSHLGVDKTAASSAASGGPVLGKVASVAQIGGDKGDVKIRMNPRDWSGEEFKGRTASQCPPEFLEIYAEQLDYFASKATDPKKAGFDALDASRCRRWAIEIREGRGAKSQEPPQRRRPPPSDDSTPFDNDRGLPPDPDAY